MLFGKCFTSLSILKKSTEIFITEKVSAAIVEIPIKP